jgi:hypothetical protein
MNEGLPGATTQPPQGPIHRAHHRLIGPAGLSEYFVTSHLQAEDNYALLDHHACAK